MATDKTHSDVQRTALMTYLGFHHHKLMTRVKAYEDLVHPEDYKELLQSFMVCYGTINEIENKYLEALNAEED